MEPRAATKEDAEELVRLAALMFESSGLSGSDPVWQTQGRDHIRDRIGGVVAAFVVDDPEQPGHLVACAAGTILSRLANPQNPSGRFGYVQWVCTEPDYRGRGLGRLVMSELLKWYEEEGVPIIELHATEMAEGLYRSLGFNDTRATALRLRS